MKLSRIFTAIFLAASASGAGAADWRYSLGLHDFTVPDVDSHTRGLNAGIAMDQRSDNSLHYFGSFTVFLDHDTDHLDPDHVPVWWQIHLGSDGDFWRNDDEIHAGWTANFDTRMNTASSTERQMAALPALVGGYDGEIVQASLEAGAGWFFLEIDDDAPREQGYDRTNLRNTTIAYATTAKLALKLGESWSLSGLARGWWDSSTPLEGQYLAALRMDASSWAGRDALKQPALVLSTEYYRYNLDIYNAPNMPPILGWDYDLMIRLAAEAKW